MNLLFFDVSTKTGWAAEIGGKIEVGKEVFETKRGESNGMRFMRFRIWVDHITELVKPGIIGYEQAHYRGGAATELCVGFITRVQEVAAAKAIQYTGVHSGTLKKFITGSGKGDKSQVMERIKTMFPQIESAHGDNDIADALAGLCWLKNEYGVGHFYV